MARWRRPALTAVVFSTLIPAVAVAYATGLIADRIGKGLGDLLTSLAGPSEQPRTGPETTGRERGAAPDAVAAPALDERAIAIAPTTRRSSPGTSAATSSRLRVVPRKGLRVSADTVLRLANSGARPSGAYVPASAERPAGLALSGVSGLGIGLEDGDVLTEAAGRPATSSGDVISVVVAARGRGAGEVSGVFWRDGEPWALVVEQPYIVRTGAAAGAAAPQTRSVPGRSVQDRSGQGSHVTGRVSGKDARGLRKSPRTDTAKYAMVP